MRSPTAAFSHRLGLSGLHRIQRLHRRDRLQRLPGLHKNLGHLGLRRHLGLRGHLRLPRHLGLRGHLGLPRNLGLLRLRGLLGLRGHLRLPRHLALLALLAFLPEAAAARSDPWQIGPHVLVAIPADDFENVSGIGGGLAIRGNFELSDLLSLRGDAAYLSYGRKLESLDFGPSIGRLPAETTSQNYRLLVGPQLSFQRSRYLVYLSSQAGTYLFRTSIAVPGTTYSDSRDTNWALGWNGGLGVQVDVGLGPWLDVGVQYQTIYDLPGAVTENPQDPGSAPVQGPNIDAQELTLQFGVHFFLTD